MLKEIIISIQAWMQAHRFIVTHRLWKWIVIPGLIYTALFCAGVFLFWKSSGSFIGYTLTHTGIKAWLEGFSNSGFVSFIFLLIQIAVQITLFYFYFSLFKYLFLIIGSPVFAYLSEKTQSIIDGKEYDFSFAQLLKDIARAVKLALRNALWQTVYSVCILFISFIPVVGLATVVLAFFVECYYLGFSMLDYSCERNKLSASQSIAFIGRHKGLAIGNGAVFYLVHLLPFIGWVLAPGYAVIAATISLNNNNKS
jgi:CysZ protein